MNDISGFVTDTEFLAYKKDKMKRFAVERQLLVIGEAANYLSEEARDQLPNVP